MINPLEYPQIADLASAVANLIKSQLATNGHVHSAGKQILLSISRFEVEHRLGNLLQQIYRAVDQHIPVRKADLSLVIRDAEGLYENSFKIWRSA